MPYYRAPIEARAEMTMPRGISELSDAADESKSNLEKSNFKLRLRLRQLEQSNRQLTRALVDVGDTNDQLRQIFEGAKVGFCTLDASGRIRELNSEAARLLGVAQRKCLDQKLIEFMSEPDRGKYGRGAFSNSLVDTDLRRGVEVTLRANDNVARLRLILLGESSATGNRGYVATLEDVRESRHSLDTESRFPRVAAESRFHQVAANVDDVYYELDGQGNVAHLSAAYEKVWGAAVASALSKPWFQAVHPDDRQSAEDARQVLLKGGPFDEEYRIVWPDGSVRWIRDRAFILDSTKACVVGVARDVTQDKELVDQLRQAQKLEAFGVLASRVTHDFGNLLQGVMGCLNIALSQASSPERSMEYTRQALAAVRGGTFLVQQLVKFGRKEPVRARPVSVDEVIAQCSKLLEVLLGDGIELEIESAAPETTILADPAQLEQILMNLAANARDAMPKGGRVVIKTRKVCDVDALGQRRHMLRLEVRDVGCGMDAATQARVFEPFFTTKGAGKGTGLGLATVRAVTHELCGRVTFETEIGQGTRFVFHFPVADGKPDAPALPVPPVSEMRFRGRALLVEDDDRVRMTVRRDLETLGFEVFEAGDGSNALSQGNDDLRLLVADIVLPDVYGTKIRDQLRRRHPQLRTLYISAHPESYLVQRGLLSEGDLVLQKPFAVDDLALSLAKLSLNETASAETTPAFRPRPGRLSEGSD
jgi:PAS domain S-box-containing protein